MLKSAGILALFIGLAVSASTNHVLKDAGKRKGKCTKMHPTFTAGFTETYTVKMPNMSFDGINYGVLYSDSRQGRKLMMNMTGTDLTSGVETPSYLWQLGQYQYLAIPSIKTCYKTSIPGSSYMFTDMANGSKYLGVMKYGGRRDGMKAEYWYTHYQDKDMTVDVGVTLSYKTCTLNTLVSRVALQTGPMQYQMEFYDLEKRVKDPNVFTLPDYCKKAGESLVDHVESDHLKYL